MLPNLDIENFINKKIIKRSESLLKNDLLINNDQLNRRINGKSALVIGGAGTIGSSYIKSLLKFKPNKLVVIDTNENGLTELVRDLRSSSLCNIPLDFITYPINFGDIVFEKIFKSHGPFHIVANFAAHKHVRSEKDIFSIQAMIENNLIQAKKLLDILVKDPPEHFFCVSTDKATNPVNIMGASKKLMEKLIMAYSSILPIKTARFANVAFSNGSLLLGFINRLNKLQPWSCPIGIKRYFVSPTESGEICLMASILGDSGDIFFPKLNLDVDMISFEQIAKDFLIHLGLKIDVCISEEEARNKSLLLTKKSNKYPVYFFDSDTSGEKSYEEFYTDNETLDMKSFDKLGVIKNSEQINIDNINSIFLDIKTLFDDEGLTKEKIVKMLNIYLPNFDHIETGKNLDQKM